MRRKSPLSVLSRQRNALGAEDVADADLLGGIHFPTEGFGLDHMRREEEVQGIAKSRDVSETILFRIVGTIVVHHVRRGKWYYRSRDVGNRRRKSPHHGRPV